MQDATTLFIPLFIAVIVISLVVYTLANRRRKLRAEEAQSFAARYGFRSEGDVNPFLGITLDRPEVRGVEAGSAASPIIPGMLVDLAARRGTTRNVFRGATAAGEAILFDYRAPDPLSDNPSEIFSTVAAYRLPGIPEFQMMLQGRFNFGLKDIDFPSNPRFSKRFMLLGNDEVSIRKLFSSTALEACEALSENRKWYLQAGWGWLFVTFGEARQGDREDLVEQSARVAAAMQ